jgi:DinB superfamily
MATPPTSEGAFERCDVCGFTWSSVPATAIAARLDRAVDALIELVRSRDLDCTTRPASARWSILEYAGHVRDVLLTTRERMILASVEDTPVPAPMYREHRVDMGLYRFDTTSDVAAELATARDLFVKTFRSLPVGYLDRDIVSGYPVRATRTLQWTAAQALHECEHHLQDARENAERTS